jgi:two-component system OmpR family sensor kinase
MKKSSIFVTITLIFFIAAVGVGVAYLYMLKYDKQKYSQELDQRYLIVSRATLSRLLTHPIDKEFEKELENYKVKLIKNANVLKKVLQEGEILGKISTRIGKSSIYFYEKNNYLLIESLNKKAIVLADQAYKPYVNQILYIKLIFSGIILLLFILYLLLIKKIRPIKKIKREIDKFAAGELNIDCQMNSDDEIAEVGNAFNHAVGEIKKLNNSRRLFLRNIMHELKTPITKGRISAEMLTDQKQKERLISVFQRLESMINEFTAIEQISVDGSHLKKRVYRVIDIIDEAIDVSMANIQNIEATVENDLQIKVDFKLFSIAIKNMIDNGIKYSSDSKIHIYADHKSLEFLSLGDKLPKDISYYIEPFTQGDHNNSSSFGLGLYIVHNIITAHGMKLIYEYKNGYNIFKFYQSFADNTKNEKIKLRSSSND